MRSLRLPEDSLPFSRKEIDYLSHDADHPVARLAQRLKADQSRLKHEGELGYLASLLEELDVPVESQVLVFSKTSLHVKLVGPDNPRAIYFNDRVYVGWVKGAGVIEISAIDPKKGAMFYTLAQNADSPPRIRRDHQCLVCHRSSGSLGVPGHLLRSFATDKEGNIREGFSRITHDTPLAKRWGGWYVTGKADNEIHLGNLVGEADHRRHETTPSFRGAADDLRPFFNSDIHLSPHSDAVALLALDHQVHGHNLITRVGYEARLGIESDAAELLARYLVFADAARLPGPMSGDSGFAKWFEKQGPHDRAGRTLRKLDLKTRLQTYPLSWLVFTPAFDGLPNAARRGVTDRMKKLLAAEKPGGALSGVSQEERRIALEWLGHCR